MYRLPVAGLRLPALCALLVLVGLWPLAATAVELSDEAFFADIPVVLSATRLRQPIQDAPNSITVIDREMIEASGFTEIPDLLRLVPGFIVDYDSGHLPVTGYHLLHDRYVRHQQVLIDGRSVYTPLLGGVPWVDLPITLDDIERIEVVRGPNAASYGSNSFLGVINIITRHAALDKGTRLKFNSGSNGLNEGFLRHGDKLGRLDHVLSLAYRQDHGFEQRHDDKRVRMITWRGDYQADNNTAVIFQLGYNEGPREEDNTLDEAVPFHQRYVTSQYQQVRWIRSLGADSDLQLQFYHTALRESKSYPGTDQGFFTERYDLELQHNFSLGEATRLVWGGSYRRDYSASDYYLRTVAPEYNPIYRLFGNIEHRLTPALILNGGLMMEDNGLTGTDLLPRAGINYHITPRDTLRVSVSRATREPVMTEEYPYLANFYPGGFYWENDLLPEYITAYELGYLTETKNQFISADVKLFREEIRGLINYGPSPDGPYFNNFDEATLRGIETQLTLRPGPRSRIHIAYARIKAESSNVVQESHYDIAAPRDSLSILGIWHLPRELNPSVGYYYNSRRKQLASKSFDPRQYESSSRLDLRLAKKFHQPGMTHELAGVIQNMFDDEQETRLRNVIERRYYLSYRLAFD